MFIDNRIKANASIMRLKRIDILSLICVAGFIFFCPPSFSEEEKPSAAVELPKPDPQEKESSYVYDLKSLIEKSKSNIKRVNERIKEQAVYKRNQEREQKAREYYDQGMALMEEGKTNEATEFFEKSIRITEHAEMKDYIKVSEQKFKSQAKAMRKEERERLSREAAAEREHQQRVKSAYEKAVALYKQRDYKAARDEFQGVEQLMPEFKATRSYLKLLEEKIAAQDKDEILKQKKEISKQQNEAESERAREKEMWRKELALKEEERERKLMEQAKAVYSDAVKLYKSKDFIGAKEKFQEVEWVVPDYKSTRKYLETLDRDIVESEKVFAVKEQEGRAKQEWDDELTRKKLEAEQKREFEAKSNEEKQKAAKEAWVHYQKANDLMSEKKYAQARDEFLTVQKIYPDYKATTAYLDKVNKSLGIIETAPAKVEPQVKIIYAEALQAYKEKDYGTSKLKFEQVEFMYPDYMGTRKYLSRMDDVNGGKPETKPKQEDDAKPVPVGDEVDKERYKILAEKTEPFYVEALALFEVGKFDDALKQFEMVENILPNYKSTRVYIKRSNHQIKKVEQQRYKEEQMQQAETINGLAKQASVLYSKILQLADDRSTLGAQKKFAFLERLFANMSKEQARLLAEILEEEEKLRLEEIAYEQEAQHSDFVNEIDPIYQEAVRLYKEKKYDEARAKFLEAQSKIADYRSSNRYLSLIDKQNQLLQQTIKDRESLIAEFENKAAINAELAAKLQLEAQEKAMIHNLLMQAEEINDEIVALSKDRNFEAIKVKFAELEKIVDNLLTIKMAVMERQAKEKLKVDGIGGRPVQTKAKEKTSEKTSKENKTADPKAGPELKEKEAPARISDEDLKKLQKEEVKEREKKVRTQAAAKMAEAEKSLEERRQAERENANKKMKDQQVAKQDRANYRQAVSSYHADNYPDARARFGQLESHPKYGGSARAYIKKIDDLLLQKQNKERERQIEERQEYIESRTKQEKMSFDVQQAQRDDKVQSSRSVGMNSPIVASAPGYPTTRQEYMNSLNLRARKPPVVDIGDQAQVTQMKETPAPAAPVTAAAPPEVQAAKPDAAKPEAAKPEGLSPNEDASWLKRRSQKKLSDRRKKYIEAKQKSEAKQKEKAKRKEEEKLEEQRKKEADAKQKTEERKKAESEARSKKISAQKAEAAAKSSSTYNAKKAVQNAERQRRQEEKLRGLYEQELRQNKGASSGFDRALTELGNEKRKQAQTVVEAKKKLLRQQREEEKTLRKEKERKLSTFINQGQEPTDFTLRGKKDRLLKENPIPKLESKKVSPKKEAVIASEDLAPGEDNSPKTPKVDVSVAPIAKPTSNIQPRRAFSKEAKKKEAAPKPKKAEDKEKAKIQDNDALRRKFENGLAKMYAEATGYYKKHMYKEARNRFGDVEDIAPDYKRTRTYLHRIEMEILKEQKRLEKVREDKHYNSIQPIDVPRIQKINSLVPAPAVNRKDVISNALDDFESQSK